MLDVLRASPAGVEVTREHVEVTGDEAESVKALPQMRGLGATGGISFDLKAGKVLFFPRVDSGVFGSFRTSLKRQGYAVRARVASRDGIAGCYVWAVPIEVTK